MDKTTESRIKSLHPSIVNEVYFIVSQLDAKLTGKAKMRIVQGFRTVEEQNELYAQGRTKPGSIVTNAKGGSSYHNYGLAIDFALLVDGKEISWDMDKDWDGDKIADWKEVVDMFIKAGYEWGGNWKSLKDYPHFQKTFGNTWQQLYKKYVNKDFIPNTKYINL